LITPMNDSFLDPTCSVPLTPLHML
jgi:hypothetical protein